MNLTSSFLISFQNLTSNLIRSILTMLGIIIGVMSIIILISVVSGTQDKIEGQIKSIGSNVLMIYPGNMEEMKGPPGAFTVNKLKLKDADLLETRSSYSIKVCPVLIDIGGIVKYKNKTKNTTMIAGTGANFPYVRNWDVQKGAYFREDDVRTARKVAVVGETIVKDMYGGNDPIGKDITIEGKKFMIIGITEKKGRTMGSDNDDVIAIPITTAQNIMGSDQINQILIKVPDQKNILKAIPEIKKVLLTQMTKEDFTIRSQSELLNTFSSFTDILSVVMGCVAGISLFVGGIGIMNIMLVTVKERTREIGIRKAVGANSVDIMLQFIIEAVVLSVFGGLIGIIISIIFIDIGALFSPIPLKPNILSILIAFGFSSLIGVFFGTYPAVKAAKTDPIIALRYE